jgi:hypothetical protein
MPQCTSTQHNNKNKENVQRSDIFKLEGVLEMALL